MYHLSALQLQQKITHHKLDYPVGLPIEEQKNRVSGDGVLTVDPGEFPFVVSVTFNSEHICGGFIYNSRFIVTAASCVYQ